MAGIMVQSRSLGVGASVFAESPASPRCCKLPIRRVRLPGFLLSATPLKLHKWQRFSTSTQSKGQDGLSQTRRFSTRAIYVDDDDEVCILMLGSFFLANCGLN